MLSYLDEYNVLFYHVYAMRFKHSYMKRSEGNKNGLALLNNSNSKQAFSFLFHLIQCITTPIDEKNWPLFHFTIISITCSQSNTLLMWIFRILLGTFEKMNKVLLDKNANNYGRKQKPSEISDFFVSTFIKVSLVVLLLWLGQVFALSLNNIRYEYSANRLPQNF